MVLPDRPSAARLTVLRDTGVGQLAYLISYVVYYQMNLLAFTPIEMLDDGGRYLYGLYFMVSLITTIAYGDIIGKNAFE